MVVKMSNTVDAALPQSTVETIMKLHRAGQPQEFISAITGANLAAVRQVLVQLDGPQLMQAMLAQAQQRSLRYRCAHSARLMRSPVQASNKKLYEKEVLQALEGHEDEEIEFERDYRAQLRFEREVEGVYHAELHFVKEEIVRYSKETLELIEACLVHKVDPEATLSLVSDCLSVLSPEIDLGFFLRVFEKVENSQLPQLLELLHSKSSAELMQNLLSRLTEIEGFQPKVLAISKLLLSRISLDFDLFLTVISKASASREMLNLALEVADLCTLTQLEQLREELFMKNWGSEQWRLDELSFREAELRVKNKEEAAAKELLKTLKCNLAYKDKLLEFFDRVDWKQDKLEFLDEIYSRNMKTLKDQGQSPFVEVLETLYQITQTGRKVRKIAEDPTSIPPAPMMPAAPSISLAQVMYAAPSIYEVPVMYAALSRYEAPRISAAPSFPLPQGYPL
jgi:hypothetical protein